MCSPAAALETVVDFHVYVCSPNTPPPLSAPPPHLGGSVFVKRPLFCTSGVCVAVNDSLLLWQGGDSEELTLVNLQEFNSG